MRGGALTMGWGKLPKRDAFRPSHKHQSTPLVTRLQKQEYGKTGSVVLRTPRAPQPSTCPSLRVQNAIGSVSSKNDYSCHIQYEAQEATRDVICKGMCAWVVSTPRIRAVFPRGGSQQRNQLLVVAPLGAVMQDTQMGSDDSCITLL